MILVAAVLGWLSGGPSNAEAGDGGKATGDPFETLKNVDYFAIGGVGFAGTTSEGELALKKLLSGDDPETALLKLIRTASPEGACYGWLGLFWRSPDRFEAILKETKQSAPKSLRRDLSVMSGCLLVNSRLDQEIARIAKGTFRVDGKPSAK
ncbi:MAG: hypothetical protein KDL87_13335 [Verrucomicrobiae bacterium]|nr:hypothetical protein [Verrucomicrobiae bacterium]